MTHGRSVLSRPGRRMPADPRLRARDEKLESLKAVVGKLAHDFNNFLVPQFGYLALLKEEIPANSQAAEYAASMECAGRRSEEYIQAILLGMRPHRQFAPCEFSMDELIDQIAGKWLEAIPESTGVRLVRDLEPFKFHGDPKQWRSVIEHLFSNARFALATGGKLEVTLRRQTLSGQEIQRLGLGTSEVFQLTVRDDGFGMPPEVAERAFEPFFTTRGQIKAAGLGLTITHSVTQFHGGQAELETAEDKGTTVILWIPARGVPSSERLASIGGVRPASARPKKRILLVEDEPLIKEVLRASLARLEFDVQNAANEVEAAKLIQRNVSEWVLAVLDADSPGEAAEKVYARIVEINPALPCVFLSGKERPRCTARSGREPLFLKKPFAVKVFLDAVRTLVPG